MRAIIAHDHNYSKVPDDPMIISSCNASCEVMLSKPEMILTERFCMEGFIENNDAINFYTSFQTYSHLICFNYLGNAVNHLNYRGSETSTSHRTKSQRALSPLNEFFLTLCRLRCGLLEQDLAFRFQICQSTVSRIVTTWINFLYYKFRDIPIWPSREQVHITMPGQFRRLYPNTRIIIDATEVFIQRPSNPTAQQLTFSTYKNHNTAKVLAGITPSGAFSFISPMYGGSISDRQLFIESGLLEKLEPGDGIMADKGFNISDLLEPHGVILNIPPRKNNEQLSEREIIETRRIASLRTHVERAFKRVKDFRILHDIPNNMAGLSSEIFYTCAILTNFQKPLVTDK